MVVAGVLAALFTFGTLAGPLLVRTGIDDGIKVGDRTVINQVVVAYIVIAVLSYFVYRAQVVAISRIGEDFLKELRLRLFRHLQRLSMPFYDREKTSTAACQMGFINVLVKPLYAEFTALLGEPATQECYLALENNLRGWEAHGNELLKMAATLLPDGSSGINVSVPATKRGRRASRETPTLPEGEASA